MLLSDNQQDIPEANGRASHLKNGASAVEPSIPPHPLGIRPLGNKYFTRGKDARDASGAFKALPDEVVAQLLEYLDQRTLRYLGYTCRFLFAHCMSDEVWKTVFLE
jgi:hypothetical protein